MQLVCVHEERSVLQVLLAVAGVCEGCRYWCCESLVEQER